MAWFNFLILGLATFRLTRLLVYDKITQFIRSPFLDIQEENEDGITEEVVYVKGSGIRAIIGELLSCHWCMGMWCAIFLYWGFVNFPFIFIHLSYILAIAGVGALIEEWLN